MVTAANITLFSDDRAVSSSGDSSTDVIAHDKIRHVSSFLRQPFAHSHHHTTSTMTAATTTPPERRNTPQSLRHLLFVCWILLVLQIWFASESDEFLDPQQHHYYDGVMDLPREEVISRADDGMSESHYVQFGDGNVVATEEDGGERVVEMETVDALSAAVVQSDETTMTDVQNYTQDVNESDELSTDVLNHTQDVTTT
eukprot:scaffold14241_cov171-Skeletonema_dohrnii-CCMP3373.AAC.1